jgi:hypothetical protein
VLPAHLATFTADDWPGEHDADRYGEWMAARAQWADRHGMPRADLPGEAEAWANFPDAPFDPASI